MKKPPQIKIKKASLADISEFWDFFRESIIKQFPQYSKKAKTLFLKNYYSEDNFRAWLRKKKKVLLLALDEKEISGYLLGDIPHGGVALIIWVAIRKSFQNKGIGSVLLQCYEKFAKGRSAHKIHVWTDRRARQFYKKNGYKLAGYIPKNYFGADDYLFYKEIQLPKY
jgi:ribosomal protein S18 acetylase RimI-like enzyme